MTPGLRLWTLPVLLVVVLSLVSLAARDHARFPGDVAVTLWLQSLDSDFVLGAMKAVSAPAGDWMAAALVLAVVVLLVVMRRRCDALLAGGIGLSSASYLLLKLLIGRPRPGPELVNVLEIETISSFPSGHATFALAFLGFLAYLAGICIENVSRRGAVRVGAALFILLVGASRVYLGVHWPSDILGGYLLGGLVLVIGITVHRRVCRELGT